MEPVRPSPSSDEAPTAPSADALRLLSERARSALLHQREHARDLEARLVDSLDQIAEELAEQAISQQHDVEASLESSRADLQSDADAWEQRRVEIESELERYEARLRDQAEQQQVESDRLEEWSKTLSERTEDHDSDKADRLRILEQLDETKQELTEVLAERDAMLDGQQQASLEESAANAELDKLRKERAADAERFVTLRQEFEGLESQWQTERQAIESERENFASERAGWGDKMEELRKQCEVTTGQRLDELQEKFELATEDASKYRRRIAELEEELETRAVPEQDESDELLRLRTERDQLADQFQSLAKKRRDSPQDEAVELSDLRRRFELAVEDVRQLKSEKADLEEQLANVEMSRPPVSDGLDWESQKRRLLASLEDESTPVSSERAQERATIEGAIKITDEVVAEKERELEEMQNALASRPLSTTTKETTNESVQERESQRLEQLESEWKEKFRKAELEMSVDRARIAREKVELAELRIELESQRLEVPSSSSISDGDSGGKRRRWLDKLGLGGGEQE